MRSAVDTAQARLVAEQTAQCVALDQQTAGLRAEAQVRQRGRSTQEEFAPHPDRPDTLEPVRVAHLRAIAQQLRAQLSHSLDTGEPLDPRPTFARVRVSFSFF